MHLERLVIRGGKGATMLGQPGLLTNPVAFLERLHYRGIYNGRRRSAAFLERLNRELADLVGVAPQSWLLLRHDFFPEWRRLPRSRQRLLMVLLDAARHVFEASKDDFDPWEQPGVMILDRPEAWCPAPDQWLVLAGVFVDKIGRLTRHAAFKERPDFNSLELGPRQLGGESSTADCSALSGYCLTRWNL